ncbi:MAG: lactonase family protein [Lunatimonas sp.]|uniref:lactonase family protein n=1 Tax=Lunatimonas sp. TaxID=2060141 RepID=UPI00263B881D|nr:lactonase family protein [Lunatimonas sp.]MCC5939543.1 lactonase family protein [Lunatimonas sp.]
MKPYIPIVGLLLLAAACGSPTQENTSETMSISYRFLLGSYTNAPEHGIYLVSFHPEEDSLAIENVASEPENPSFVIINKAKNRVYSVEETGGESGGKVSAFSLEQGKLTKLNTVSAGGNGPCYVTLDPSERFVIVGNYSAGNFSVIPVQTDGSLADPVQTIDHSGSSVNPRRQTKPYVHSAVFHPSENRVLIADLGTDEVVVYDFDATNEAPLQESAVSRLRVEPGAGPRHMVFNQSGDRLYLVHEITAAIGVYAYQDGQLSHLETHSLLREGFEGNVGAAEVRLSPDGAFLYASNRGDANELIVFSIGTEGKLTHVQTISSGGIAPRNFNITPDGNYLLAGNQNSNTLLVFIRDPQTGKITPTDTKLEVNKPVYITFVD